MPRHLQSLLTALEDLVFDALDREQQPLAPQ
jgi:hypothetical protein